MAKKTTIVEILYDTQGAAKNLEQLSHAIEEQRLTQILLKDELKKGKISQKEYGQQVAVSKDIQGKANTERRNTIKLMGSEKGSINQLKTAIKDLEIQNGKLNLTTKKGQEELRKNNARINELRGSLKKAKTDTKATGGAFAQLGQNLGAIRGPIGGVIQGIGGITKASLKFIATPIGAVIAALAISLQALMRYLKGSEEGQNKLNKITMVFKTIMGNLDDIMQRVGKAIFEAFSNPVETVKRLGNFIKQNLINRFNSLALIGKAVAKIFSKDWKQGFRDLADAGIQFTTGVTDGINKVKKAAESAKNAIASINEEMSREIAIAKNLADRQADLDKLVRSFLVRRAKLQKQIAEARAIAADKENVDAQTRFKALKEAVALEEEILETDIKIAKQKSFIKTEQNKLSNSTKEDLDEEARLRADVFMVEKSSFERRKRLTSELVSVQRELNADLKKEGDQRDENLRKRIEAEEKEAERQASLKSQFDEEMLQRAEEEKMIKAEVNDFIAQGSNELLGQLTANHQAEINSVKRAENEKLKSVQKSLLEQKKSLELRKKQELALVKGNAKAEQAVNEKFANEEERLNELAVEKEEKIRSDYNKKLVRLKRQQFIEEKIQAGLQAVINTAIAVTKALTAGPIAGPPLATTIGALGAAQIALIAAKQPPSFSSDQVFEDGGMFIAGGKDHSQGGTKFFGDDGSAFEAQRGEPIIVLKREAAPLLETYNKINQAAGGAPITKKSSYLQDGGTVEPIDFRSMIREELENITIVTRVGDIETGLTEFNNVQNNAVI